MQRVAPNIGASWEDVLFQKEEGISVRKVAGMIGEVIGGLNKKAIKVNTKNMADELSKVKEVPLSSIVINSGARDYGPPPNVSERRM